MIATLSLTETIRAHLAQSDEPLRLPATFEEYVDVLDELEGQPITVLFNQGILTAFMSQASEPHEIIVGNLITALNGVFRDHPDVRVMGSSRTVYVPDCDRTFNPDVLVVKGPTELVPKPRKMAATLNPWLLIEVLSDSTEGTDFAEKLPCYKLLPSVEQILFVAQHRPFATLFTRTAQPGQWLNDDFATLEATVPLAGQALPLREVYRKVPVGQSETRNG